MKQVSVIMPFDGKEVLAVEDQEGKVWISVKRICENIGIDNARQQSKIIGDPRFTYRHMSTHDTTGRNQQMFCIFLKNIDGWLFNINANKVRADIRPKLIAYQNECMEVLHKHFMPRGVEDLSSFMSTLTGIACDVKIINTKLDHLSGINLTVFGDDAGLIKELIEEAAKHHQMTIPEYWGRVRKECDVSSYKLQNRKIINWIRRDIGKGITLVKETDV